jgi:hypothetical protein
MLFLLSFRRTKKVRVVVLLSFGMIVALCSHSSSFSGAATMKINKSKLKNMVEKGAPVAPVSIKRKRVDEGQSFIPFEPSVSPLKRAPTNQVPPSIP